MTRHSALLATASLALVLAVVPRANAAGEPSQTTIAALTTAVPATQMRRADYVISPQDMLAVDVFQVPDLSRTVQVDGSGHILLPLIGQVMASGQTAEQLSNQIAQQLGRDYLKNPQVTVTVKDSLSQKVTVDGAVMQPGIYPIAGNTTLLEAVALAKGPDQHVANIDKVEIFRNSGNQRMAAVYNLADIRDGKMADPQVFANDVIVVDTSGTKSFFHNLLGDLAPVFGVLRPY